MAQNLILNADQIDLRITRIAYQIYEYNINEKQLILAGVTGTGHYFATLLEKELNKICDIKITIGLVNIDKKSPAKGDISIDLDDKDMKNKVVILVDDVVKSGMTSAYAMRALLNVNVKKIEIAVMVNRSHKSFPIYSKYTGYELATSIKEHIDVHLKGKNKGVYLN
ncbi:MAG: phosphoribosyltransferase family protein [Reichenbachiella sp.]